MLATVLLIIHILVSIFICIVILMQSSKGEGLSGAFGLGQGTTSFFGADTANVLVKITAVLAVVFMLTSLSLAYIQSRKARPVALETEAAMTAPPGEEGEESGEAKEAPVTEGETTPEAGKAEGPGADEAAEELPADEPGLEPGPGEPDKPDAGEPLAPTGTES